MGEGVREDEESPRKVLRWQRQRQRGGQGEKREKRGKGVVSHDLYFMKYLLVVVTGFGRAVYVSGLAGSGGLYYFFYDYVHIILKFFRSCQGVAFRREITYIDDIYFSLPYSGSLPYAKSHQAGVMTEFLVR